MSVTETERKFKSNRNVTYACHYHVVGCPKYRRPVLVHNVDARLKTILSQVARERQADILEMEIMLDHQGDLGHVHLLVDVDPQFGIHRLVRYLKGRSSHDLRQEFPWLRSRLPTLWTNSNFVATVGGAPRSIIKPYIENQKNA